WWLGAVIGLVQAVFVLTMTLPVLPALHPRMADEQYGPTVVRQLEPPGFLGLHYGIRTPISVLVAHTIFGITLCAFYVVKYLLPAPIIASAKCHRFLFKSAIIPERASVITPIPIQVRCSLVHSCGLQLLARASNAPCAP